MTNGYSTQYIAAIVAMLAVLLPKFGIMVGTEELTTWITAGAVCLSGLWVMYKRTQLQEAPGGFGDVEVSGVRKS